jgi:hypothetical protein
VGTLIDSPSPADRCGFHFADADDREQPRAPRRAGLRGDERIELAIIPAALGMSAMTALAPASFSISAPMSPVWWPENSVWQSCPPMATRPPAIRAA